MTDKSEVAYFQVFKYSKLKILEKLFVNCMADFELAKCNAIKVVFRGITILHCWFHYSQVFSDLIQANHCLRI